MTNDLLRVVLDMLDWLFRHALKGVVDIEENGMNLLVFIQKSYEVQEWVYMRIYDL